MFPIRGGHPARIDHMSQIIFGIGQYERRVTHFIVFVGVHRFAGRRDVCCTLSCRDGGFTTHQTDKPFIEMIQPSTQYSGAIPAGIGGDKNHLDLFPHLRGHPLKAVRDISHVEGTLIRTMSIAEKEQRDIPLGL